MKTPIQEMLEYLLEYYNIYGFNEEPFINKEKEFAKQCFEAGRKFGMDNSYSIEWGVDTTQPDFDNWYKQFEQ